MDSYDKEKLRGIVSGLAAARKVVEELEAELDTMIYGKPAVADEPEENKTRVRTRRRRVKKETPVEVENESRKKPVNKRRAPKKEKPAAENENVEPGTKEKLEALGFDPRFLSSKAKGAEKETKLAAMLRRYKSLIKKEIPQLEKLCEKYGADCRLGKGKRSDEKKKSLLAVRIIQAG